jgi:predicted neuraminidase
LKSIAICLTLLLASSIAPAQSKPGSEFIFAPGSTPFPESHASTVVVLKNGDLMAAWFGGTKERAPDVAIWGSRRIGGKWTAPVELEREKGVPSWNPVLFHTADGRLWLYYKVGPSPGEWAAGRMYSEDEGKTWSRDERLPAGLLGPIRAKPLVLADRTIVSGTSVEAHETWACWIERSTDGGRTWAKIGPIDISREMDAEAKPWPEPEAGSVSLQPGSDAKPLPRKFEGMIQPSVIDMGGTHLRLYARTRGLAARIAAADSYDNGATWTQAHYLDMPNNNSGIDAVRLKDGRIVMIYNNTANGRTPLNLAVSRDGEHFKMFATLEDTPGQFSYPAIVEAADGGLEITYTWKRETIKYVHLPLRAVPDP